MLVFRNYPNFRLWHFNSRYVFLWSLLVNNFFYLFDKLVSVNNKMPVSHKYIQGFCDRNSGLPKNFFLLLYEYSEIAVVLIILSARSSCLASIHWYLDNNIVWCVYRVIHGVYTLGPQTYICINREVNGEGAFWNNQLSLSEKGLRLWAFDDVKELIRREYKSNK